MGTRVGGVLVVEEVVGVVGVVVCFEYGDDFDSVRLGGVAEMARVKFEGMVGLRSKVFTVDADARRAVNFYVWESEEAGRAFFTDEMLEQVAGLYGVRPSVEFVEVLQLVDNARL